MEYIFIFLAWTFVLYWMHRFAHYTSCNVIKNSHCDHHRYIIAHNGSSWHWNNLFLFNETWASTVDLWLTEVIPTIIFSFVTGYWGILIFYYLWSALIQEKIEHNANFNMYPWITSGKWHLLHHRYADKNLGLFIPIWDILFKTYQPITD